MKNQIDDLFVFFIIGRIYKILPCVGSEPVSLNIFQQYQL